MQSAPKSAARAGAGRKKPSRAATALPTSTGTTAAARVGMRSEGTKARARLGAVPLIERASTMLGKPTEPAEVGLPPLEIGVPPFLGLLAHVEEQGGIPGQFLQSRLAITVRVQRRLQAPERERAHLEHLPAPGDRLLLESVERDDRVHEPHVERLLGVVLPAKEPDLACLLLADDAREIRGAESTVE